MDQIISAYYKVQDKGCTVKGTGCKVADTGLVPFTLNPVPSFTLRMVLALLLFCSCENRELSADDPCLDQSAVEVVIHWDGINPADKPPQGMTAHLFAQDGRQGNERANLPADGGRMDIANSIPYFTLCYDYYGNENIHFRNENNLDLFEAYNAPATGLHNTYGPNSTMVRAATGEAEENTVAEPYPYNFFVARNEELFTVRPVPGQTQYLHFYPRNVLREFTFLVVGVKGTPNIANAFGAISGMSPVYRMRDGATGSEPVTVLFGNREGRVTWPGDSITGAFCTFGPAGLEGFSNRLTVEVVTSRHNYYYAVWGGVGENTVREQLAGALGEHGTWEEQLDWRRRNGGYDIVLRNDGRLVIPDDPADGTFIVDVGDYDNVIVPLPLK